MTVEDRRAPSGLEIDRLYIVGSSLARRCGLYDHKGNVHEWHCLRGLGLVSFRCAAVATTTMPPGNTAAPTREAQLRRKKTCAAPRRDSPAGTPARPTVRRQGRSGGRAAARAPPAAAWADKAWAATNRGGEASSVVGARAARAAWWRGGIEVAEPSWRPVLARQLLRRHSLESWEARLAGWSAVETYSHSWSGRVDGECDNEERCYEAAPRCRVRQFACMSGSRWSVSGHHGSYRAGQLA